MNSGLLASCWPHSTTNPGDGPCPKLLQHKQAVTKVSCIWFAGWVSLIFFTLCMQEASGLSVRWVACVENRHGLADGCRTKAPQAPQQVFGPDQSQAPGWEILSDLKHPCPSCPTPLPSPALRGGKTNTRTMVETSPNCDRKRSCARVGSLAFSFKGVQISQRG